MKKIVFTGIVLVLVMMFVITCEEAPETGAVEYTDVVYSPDGSEITLYLDGIGVPVTPAQRAVNKDLATMAYDFFEVVFVGGAVSSGNTARATWELGERAGIYDVPRGPAPVPPAAGTGLNYGWGSSAASAAMFVGKKSDKTLLGIGYVSAVTPANGTSPVCIINEKTSKVTFSIGAIKTALIPESGGYQGVPQADNSFTSVHANFTAPTGRASVNGSPLQYPKYILKDATATVTATYKFGFVGTNNVLNAYAKVIVDSPILPAAPKRVPRFMNGGRYMEPKDGWTAVTTVAITTALTDGLAFPANGNIDLSFGTRAGATGVFSFYIDIPVYAITKLDGGYLISDSDNYVPFEVWHIRTGVGAELYSLDDGVANGGCVFMQVGDDSQANWIDIDWVWL